jgi:3-oxoacyl-[acyl-carrier protein] reductase
MLGKVMNISDKVALVTGGSGGLGSRICSLLAAEGVNIAVGFHHGQERAETVRDEIEVQGRRAIVVAIDQTNPNSIDTAIAQVTEQMGGLDILVNNAAMASGGHSIPLGDLAALTPEIWDEMMTVNLRGPYLVTRAAAPHLKSSDWGRVVNIGSTLGHGEWYADRPFAPSKMAVVPLTRFLAAALAPDVAVNCVSPGLMVETGLGSGGPDHLIESWRNRAALNVTTSIDDVAGQVVYLCKSSTITGKSIVVDGGIHFH